MDQYYQVVEFFRSSFGMDKITSKSPMNYKDRIYVTAEADELMLPQVLEYLGDDKIMVSEDMPHFEERDGSGDDLGARTDITQTQKEKILHRNAAKIYGIKVKDKKRMAQAAE